MIDEKHAAPVGIFTDDGLALFFGADKEHGATVGDRIDHVAVGLAEHLHGDIEIDDVDAVARPVDVRFHLRVPPPGLMTEVQAGFQHLTHCYCCHENFSLFWLFLHPCADPARCGTPRQVPGCV